MSDETIQTLQEMIAHQAREIADLNAVVTAQWGEIDVLKAQLRKVLSKIDVIEDSVGSGEGASVDVKPPHY